MVNTKDLVSDIDFVKEFEELRLKQKLLIESLSKKNKEDKNSSLAHINSKLDFLVNIFKDAQNNQSENSVMEKKLSELFEKVESLETSINDVSQSITSNMEIINKKLDSKKETLSSSEGNALDNSSKIDSINKDDKSSLIPPPAPNFDKTKGKI
jgi:uncharacterized coiled-coil protein SlyX